VVASVINRVRSRIPAISLFTGSGGMDLGFMRAGFDVRVAVEVDPAACETLEGNFPELRGPRLVRRPLESVPTIELLRVAGLERGEPAIVFGGPPCQSWCIAGNRLGLGDPRGRSLLEFLRVVREAQPLTFCIENVPGLLNHSGLEALKRIREELNWGSGDPYEVTADILDAAEYGVPQHRKRVFIVGWRGPGEFYFPAPSRRVKGTPARGRKGPAATVGEALQGLPAPTPPSEIAHRVATTIPRRNERWYGKR
jgi:DNA (cytosine-5)-methyltransferase 1